MSCFLELFLSSKTSSYYLNNVLFSAVLLFSFACGNQYSNILPVVNKTTIRKKKKKSFEDEKHTFNILKKIADATGEGNGTHSSTLAWKSHGWRSLVACSPWGFEESDMTERLHFHFSLSCIREGNGNPLQYSCLENPRDGGAWWAAVYGVAQSRTRLKRLSSSSSSS